MSDVEINFLRVERDSLRAEVERLAAIQKAQTAEVEAFAELTAELEAKVEQLEAAISEVTHSANSVSCGMSRASGTQIQMQPQARPTKEMSNGR